jgi:hypothetical protein
MTFQLFSPHIPLYCVGALFAWALSGCHSTTALDRHFGQAVKNAQSGQTLRSERVVTQDTGMDAGVIRSGIERYEKSYITPPTPLTSLDQGLGQAGSGALR